MVFDKSIRFYGTYRPYQQRVLDNLEKFLDNEKIHVVAAPGSGKTTLGIELIKRLDQPSLILVPSIAIREQWIHRFSTSFLKNPEEKERWISNSIFIQKPIICITYQALYSAYKKEKNSEVDDEIIQEENDFRNFNLFSTIQKYKIQTVCLDECHHLKSEWWKVLETLLKRINDCKVIALTATPPYDSSSLEWQRYIELCGPIDEEIFVPELIKDHNLCPHHDFVYFSFPSFSEEKKIMNFYANGLKIFHKYKNDAKLIEIIASNKIYLNYKNFKRLYYYDEEYYDAFIAFLIENHIKVPFKVKLLTRHFHLDIKHFEILLQHVLFDDQNAYLKDDKILSIKKELSALGVVYNRHVNIVHDERINKKLALSLSKLDSIQCIVTHEQQNMKDKLRCLILTDYIKIQSKSDIGNDDKPIESFGTIPIFEHLRRGHIEGVNLCCLSGSTCILPRECISMLHQEFAYESLSDTNYIELLINQQNRKRVVAFVTQLFEEGIFNVLIGTKSLLGEGWDSPCINTLIMASFIGSYVLSNQMRGRAIRIDPLHPQKKSNIWHLVCLNPFDYHFSYDYYNLQKRFSTFIGVDLANERIENGMERLNFPRIPYNHYEAQMANEKTLSLSANREKIEEVWNKCLQKAKSVDNLTKETIITKKRLRKEYSFYHSFFSLILSLGLSAANYGFYLNLIQTSIKDITAFILCVVLQVIFLIFAIIYAFRFFNLINPKRKLKTIGEATLRSLEKTKHITSKKVKVVTNFKNNDEVSIHLVHATTYEQNLFSDCILQMLQKIKQPRYLIVKPKYLFQSEFYIVPDAFKKNKELVTIFEKELAKTMGNFAILFAKSETGKNIVLKAEKIYYIKYRKISITTKNILLDNTKKKKWGKEK